MEQFNQEDWLWVGVAPDVHDCVFCGQVVANQHLGSCPSNLISVTEGTISLWTNINNEFRSEDEIAQDIGKTIMYAADLIIKSQKEWGTKHILEKLDDVLNDWGLVTEFVEVLMELNIIQSATEVIDFYKNPTMYEKEFLLWEEYDYPYSDDEAWHDFKKVVMLSQHGDTL